MTEDQAKRLDESKFWENMSYRDKVTFQLFEDRLCMPFNVFLTALKESLGREVFLHELKSANIHNIEAEFLDGKNPPTPQEIIDLIPEEKRIIIVTDEDHTPDEENPNAEV